MIVTIVVDGSETTELTNKQGELINKKEFLKIIRVPT